MGNFYVNITTRKAKTDEILIYLKSKKLSAYLIEGPKDFCAIYEEVCDDQQTGHISNLLKEISQGCNCAAIGMLNHDDDILAYELWLNGMKVDEYDSCPGYFSGDEDHFYPEGGDAKLLAELMGDGGNIEAIYKVLKAAGDEGYVFAIERHEALVKAIGLPIHSVGYGFRYISGGEIPQEIKEENIIKCF
jgi:hypothetical protein